MRGSVGVMIGMVLAAGYPASQLRQAPAVQQPTLGQLSGIAWLAWILDRSGRG
jgi:hypothetical protein